MVDGKNSKKEKDKTEEKKKNWLTCDNVDTKTSKALEWRDEIGSS